MEKFYRSEHAVSADADKVAREIQICRVLIERLLKDEYAEVEFDKLYKKWGEPSLRTEPYNEELSQLFIDYENVKTKEDEEKFRKEFKYVIQLEGNRRERDISFLFEVLSKRIEGWWD
jgi:hypothetical protein